MASSRRRNDASPLEVEPSTAGATGRRDLGWVANLGELSAWLQEDGQARMRFVTWYNAKADELAIPKSITSDNVLAMALDMFYFASNTIAQARRS